MGDDLLNYFFVTFIDQALFLEVSKDIIVGAFMEMPRCRVE
jgi:hypothetical protein